MLQIGDYGTEKYEESMSLIKYPSNIVFPVFMITNYVGDCCLMK